MIFSDTLYINAKRKRCHKIKNFQRMVEEVIAPVKRFESGVVTVNEMHSDRALRYTKKLKAIEDVIDVR